MVHLSQHLLGLFSLKSLAVFTTRKMEANKKDELPEGDANLFLLRGLSFLELITSSTRVIDKERLMLVNDQVLFVECYCLDTITKKN